MPRRRLVWLSVALTAILGATGFAASIAAHGGWLVWSDGAAYFLYARSLVIDGDLAIANEFHELSAGDAAGALSELRYWARSDPDSGRLLTPWPVGAGVAMAPFYAVGYTLERLLAALSGRPPDSYGLVAQLGFASGALCYGLLGVWSLAAACRRLTGVADSDALLAAIGVTLAGPAAFYILVHPSMAHAVSYGLAAMALRLWAQQWQTRVSVGGMLLLGGLCGALAAIRYQHVLFGLLPALLLLRALAGEALPRVLLCGVAGLAAALLPLSLLPLGAAPLGGEVADAYGEMRARLQPGQILLGPYPFDLRSPFFFDVLFSPRHGALHWAPLLGVALLALLAALARAGWAWALLLSFAAQVYLIGALGLASPGFTFDEWETHWRGAPAFGMRYLTEAGVLLAPGLALALAGVRRWPGGGRLARAVLALAVLWNGLLIAAYGLRTVSRSAGVSYAEMLGGVGQALTRLLELWR